MIASASHPAQIRVLLVAAFFLALNACGGGGGSSPPPTYSLSATVSGLTSSGLVLSVNGQAAAIASGATSVTLASALKPGSAYTVSVQTQPTGNNCSVANGTGAISSAASTVAVNCSVVYTIGGSISGLASTGLVLLNNDGDATTIPANATQFSMQTKLAPGASYNITVGHQPSGFFACTIAGASGTATAAVTTVAVTCAAATPTQTTIASYFCSPQGVAVDGAGNVFVTDSQENTLEEIPYVDGNYGAPVVIASGFNGTGNVAVDAAGNVFVAETFSGAVKEVPYSDGKYGTPVVIGSGFNAGYGFSLAVNAAGSVFVANTGSNIVQEIPYSGGSYGAAVVIGTGFKLPQGVAVDATGNVYVADTGNDVVKKIPYSGSYGTPVAIGPGFTAPLSVAVDSAGNVFVVNSTDDVNAGSNSAVAELPITGSSYGAPVVIGSGFVAAQQSGGAQSVALDAHGNVFVTYVGYLNYDAGLSPVAGGVKEIPYSGGSYSAPVLFGTGLFRPYGVAVDATGNVYVTDTGDNTVKEIPYSGGSYGTPIVIGTGFNQPQGVAVDAGGNVFVADSGNNVVKEIPYSAGKYGAPVTIGTGFDQTGGLAVDAHGNLFVTSTTSVMEIPYSAGQYGTPLVFQGGFVGENGALGNSLAVDATGTVFVVTSFNSTDTVIRIPSTSSPGYDGFVGYVNSSAEVPIPLGIAVDASDNVYVAAFGGPTTLGAVEEFPYLAPTTLSSVPYSAEPDIVGGTLIGPSGVAVDAKGQLYVVTLGNVLKFAPP